MQNFDTTALKTTVNVLEGLAWGADTAVSATTAIPFNLGVAAAMTLAAATRSNLIAAQRLLKDRDDDLASCILKVADEGQMAAAQALSAIEGPGGLQDSVNGVQESVDGVQESVDGVQNSVDDGFNFLACPFTIEQQNGKTSIGQGCDGLDNNCNSVVGVTKRVVSS